ncbi:hypothetical protein T03_10420, partial [Trichinella britovi]
LKICQPLKPANQTIRVNKRNSCHAFQRARPHRQPMIKPNSSSTVCFSLVPLLESENLFHSQLTRCVLEPTKAMLMAGTDQFCSI